MFSKRRIVSVVPWLLSELNDLHDGGSRGAVHDGLVGPPDESVAVTDAAVRQISGL
jgi:hypothetical protein